MRSVNIFKIGIFVITMGLLIFPFSANAQRSRPVTVVNDDSKSVPVHSTQPTDVNVVSEPTEARDVVITNTEPIPVTMDQPVIVYEGCKKEIVSYHVENVDDSTTLTVVPPDKQFILTDIVLSEPTNIALRHKFDISGKIVLNAFRDHGYTTTYSWHFQSGIPFTPGSSVIYNPMIMGAQPIRETNVFISGYLIDN